LKGTRFPSKNEWCFSFCPDDFKQLWPNEKPCQELNDCSSERWVATKEMVDKAYQAKRRLSPVQV
jgi:hypothetical protein